MVFNKTKRGLEKGAAILAVVTYSIQILIFLFVLIVGIKAFSTQVVVDQQLVWNGYSYQEVNTYGYRPDIACVLVIFGAIFLTYSILGLIFGAKLIKSPLQKNGTVVNTNKFRITLLVFSVLSGNLITAGLMIAVLCLKDVVAPKTKPELQQIAQPTVQQQAQPTSTIEAKIAKLKEYKELGIIDEETYKKAVAKLIKEIM